MSIRSQCMSYMHFLQLRLTYLEGRAQRIGMRNIKISVVNYFVTLRTEHKARNVEGVSRQCKDVLAQRVCDDFDIVPFIAYLPDVAFYVRCAIEESQKRYYVIQLGRKTW